MLQYVLYVKSLGDGVNYLDSDEASVPISFGGTEKISWKYTFNSNPFKSATSEGTQTAKLSDDNNLALDWNWSGKYLKYENSLLALSSNSNNGETTFSTNSFIGEINNITINAKTNSKKKVSISVYVNNQQIENTVTLDSETTLADYTFKSDVPLKGEIKISFTDQTGGYQIKSISINQ